MSGGILRCSGAVLCLCCGKDAVRVTDKEWHSLPPLGWTILGGVICRACGFTWVCDKDGGFEYIVRKNGMFYSRHGPKGCLFVMESRDEAR